MSVQLVEELQQYLRRLCDQAMPPEDTALLKRFVADNDREAFELLIARHGPLALGTARRSVDNSHDAEDVFQAVFLSLARQAKTIRQGCTLPAWLHKTTCRIAAKVRNKRRSRSIESLPEPCESSDPSAELVWREVRRVLDEELQRLNDRLRSPLLLCYLSGLTRDEAAKQLGLSLNTLKRRLEEGRNLLRTRLERRGIAAVGLALAVLDPKILQAALSKSQVESILNLVFVKAALVPATISGLVLGSATAMKGVAIKALIVLFVAAGVAVGIYAGAGRDTATKADEKKEIAKLPEEKKGELWDDPLPASSIVRFGTSRFRNGAVITNLAVSTDGKIAVVCSAYQECRAFDLNSGRELYSLSSRDRPQRLAPVAMSLDRHTIWDREPNNIEAVAISPDGKSIVAKEDQCLQVYDSATGRNLRKIELPRSSTYANNKWVAFTPDGKGVAVTSEGGVVHLLDFDSGKAIHNFEFFKAKYIGRVNALAFSADGKLMAGGSFDIRIWDVKSGKEVQQIPRAGYRQIFALQFSPDGKTLAGGGSGGQLVIWDVDTGKERRAFPKDGAMLRSVAFAPDGKRVAASGDSMRIYDTLTGEERLRVDRAATCLQFTDDGKTLTGADAGAICRWDANTGKPLTPASDGDSMVEQILVTPDGKRVITRGQQGDAHIWDGAGGKQLKGFIAASRMAMSPDGRFLAWVVEDKTVEFIDTDYPYAPKPKKSGSRICLYDIAAEAFVDRFPGFKGVADRLAFSADGKRLVAFDSFHGMVRLWDFAAGKEERHFAAVQDAERNDLTTTVRRRIALSPDGKTLAVANDHDLNRLQHSVDDMDVVRIWDVAAGKERHELKGHMRDILDMAFSPDGRFLVTAGNKATEFNQQGGFIKSTDQVFVWQAATGKRTEALPDGLPIGACAIAFSRDGRFLATAAPDGMIQLWETATWTLWNEFKQSHRDRPTALTFGPGSRLYSGSLDTTVLAWDTRPPRNMTGSLETAWTDLAKPAGGTAFKAEGRFLAAPAETIKFFTARIKTVEDNSKRIKQLIADLDDAKFAVRESASKTLSELGEQAKLSLEEAIKTANSAEVVDRIRKILQEPKKMTPEQLRQSRAVLVLELMNDAESKKLLKKWAGGFKGAFLTEEAGAALNRSEGVFKAKP